MQREMATWSHRKQIILIYERAETTHLFLQCCRKRKEEVMCKKSWYLDHRTRRGSMRESGGLGEDPEHSSAQAAPIRRRMSSQQLTQQNSNGKNEKVNSVFC